MMELPDIDDWAVRSGEIVAAPTPDGAHLLSLKEQKYFSLNATAAAIWGRLEKPAKLSAIRDEIVREFGAPPGEAGLAVREFVASLAQQGIVTVQKRPFRTD